MTSWQDSEDRPRNPPALYATPRNPQRETIGGEVGKVLMASGRKPLPPMPWQRDVLDVACEIDPRTGLFWYRNVILVGLRQIGKTTLTRGKLMHRGLTQPGAEMLYTAQDRNKGRERLEKTIYNQLVAGPLGAALGKPRWAAGSERVVWKNGSSLKTEALSPTSGHGDTLDEAHIDEAFAHRDNRIEQNVTPTMVTVDGAQMWIESATGDENSTYLRQKVDFGRALVESGADSRTAYIEYSAPLDADPDDPETLLNCHPAIGYTTRLEYVLDNRGNMSAQEFRRAYLGWWPVAKAEEAPIPLEAWNANFVSDELETWTGAPMWSVDVSPDRNWAAIGLAAKSYDEGARAFLEVIDHEQGTAWVIDRLLSLAGRFGGWRVALDGSGAASSLAPDLESAGFEVIRLAAHDRADACGAVYDDVLHKRLRYLNDPVLNTAMRSAAKLKAFGGEAWIFSRGKSLADITPLYAVTLARFAYVMTAPDDYDILDSIA